MRSATPSNLRRSPIPLAAVGAALLLLAPLARSQDPPAAPAPQAPAQPPTPPDERAPFVVRDWLVIPSGAGGRVPLPNDPLYARYFVPDATGDGAGAQTEVAPPKAGESFPTGRGRTGTWTAATANEAGELRHAALRSGWATATFTRKAAGAAMLSAQGPLRVSLNGVTFYGDVYHKGRVRVPVPLIKGENRIWVRAVRGRFRLRFTPCSPAPAILPEDPTLPDVRLGRPLSAVGAVLVANPSEKPLIGARLIAGDGERFAVTTTPIPRLLPFSVHKAVFQIVLTAPLAAGTGATSLALPLWLDLPGQQRPQTGNATRTVSLRVRPPSATYAVTFRSGIDGSAQYYAVRPPRAPVAGRRYALYLTLHGASVEARGQASAYAPKTEGYLVAPTNRRPFGFDWEAWGRLDALEVLDRALATLPIDPRRVYLTGHSMGGHGTWNLGVLFPERFAAIAPSAGWASLFSYGGLKAESRDLKPGEYFFRGLGPSDTMMLIENLTDLGVYVLHGSKDDNVPVTEARKLVARLRKFHKDVRYWEQPGAGHWWSSSPSPGAECVDWAPLFDFFDRRQRSVAPRHLDFRTPDPGVSSRHYWVRVLGQPAPARLSRVAGDYDPRPATAVVTLTTENIDRLELDPRTFYPVRTEVALALTIDGAKLTATWRRGQPVRLERAGKTWRVAPAPWPPAERSPRRPGLFTSAFARRFCFVYGTGGTPAMQRATLEKVRLDASTWWYQANGAVEVFPDTAFSKAEAEGRNVILYGNAETNRAFGQLLGDDAATLGVLAGRVTVGETTLNGASLSVLAVRPRADDPALSVGIVGATDVAAMRRLMPLRWFRSGVAPPDLTVFGPGVETAGFKALVASGFFARDWSASAPAGADLTLVPAGGPPKPPPPTPPSQGDDFAAR